MTHINDNFLKLSGNYLFSDIARRVNTFKAGNPDARLIRLGIGDVTLPLPQACIEAIHKAADDMSQSSSFHGYGPEQGYGFLREAIAENDFTRRGINITADEIFISDGAKSDTGNITDIFDNNNTVAVTDPVYPVYVDSNIMSGRREIIKLPCTEQNGFIPSLPEKKADIIYLCYPNNPTGTTLTRRELKKWVDYAIANGSTIFFDAAYEAFIREDDIPHSIYEIEGARRCAIEFRSFSKTAGFTGMRCGYTVIPRDLMATSYTGEPVSVHSLWLRRQSTKFNGTSYITQRAAEAIYSEEGRKQVKANIDYYLGNARIMREGFRKAGFTVYGGTDSPYLWLRTPQGLGSWQFFDRLLHKAHIVSTPGAGFGPSGEGFLRLTAFGKPEDCEEATDRIQKLNL